MSGVNKVIILGNLGADPEHRQFDGGGSVTNISVATSEKWKDKNTGEDKELTEWHRISMFNRLGEVAAQYLRKGSKVYIEGQLRTRKYQAEDGTDRYVTEIRANQMQMLDSKGDNHQQGGHQPNPQPSTQSKQAPSSYAAKPSQNTNPKTNPAMNGGGTPDDDIPFAPHFGG